MLNVKRLIEDAKLPTIAHPGEDLGYDLYASEQSQLSPRSVTSLSTGVAIEFDEPNIGGIIMTKSSWARIGLFVEGGVVDAGYRGELIVMIYNSTDDPVIVEKHNKIAQLVPLPVMAERVVEVLNLSESSRRENGFGSSGK